MDIGVLSDIHGNYVALQSCLSFLLRKNIRKFIFLGDYAGELAYPEKTMQILYDMDKQYECYFVRGNKEDYWLNYRLAGEKGWKEGDSTTGSLLYTYRHLTGRDLSFFEALQHAGKVTVKGKPDITICHGSPNKVNEKLLPDSQRIYEIMDMADTSVILCGHTHIQDRIEYGGKLVLNPGSVGVPLSSRGKSQFLILHDTAEGWSEEFCSLEYDVEKVIRELYESGLDKMAPSWCRITENMLRKGNVSHGEVLNRAMELCRTETGECSWPDIPEIFWEKAVEENKEGGR